MAEGNADSTRKLIEQLAAMRDSRCVTCGTELCFHETLMSIAAGYKNSLRCLGCLSFDLTDSRERVRDRVFMFIYSRPAYRVAWSWASQEENFGAQLPACLWPNEQKIRTDRPYDAMVLEEAFLMPSDGEVDVGDSAYDELAWQMQSRLAAMAPNQILKVLAREIEAAEDIPAWCRLTNHKLLSANHPIYFIKRREL